MYGCQNWTIKKEECWSIDAFELWYWRRLLRIPWTARRSNQSILKEINSEYSLEGLMLKLKLQYFGHLRLRKIEGKRRRWKRMRWLDGISDAMDMNLGKLSEGQRVLVCCSPQGHKDSDTTRRLHKKQTKTTFHCMAIPQFPYPFTHGKCLGCLQFGDIINNASMNIYEWVFFFLVTSINCSRIEYQGG